MIGPMEWKQLELPVECPAVSLKRSVWNNLHLLVVNLLRLAYVSHAGAGYCAIGNIRVNNIYDCL